MTTKTTAPDTTSRAMTPKQKQLLQMIASGTSRPNVWDWTRTADALVSRGFITYTTEKEPKGWSQFIKAELTPAGQYALTPRNEGQPRMYEDRAEKQHAYRQRKADRDFDSEQIARAIHRKLKEKGHYPDDMTLGQIISAIEAL